MAWVSAWCHPMPWHLHCTMWCRCDSLWMILVRISADISQNQDEASPTNGRLGSALRILSCLLQGCLGCWRSHHSLMPLPSPSPVVRTLEGAPVGLQQWRVPTRIFPGTSFTDLRVGHLKRRHRSFLLFWFVLSVVNIVIIYIYIYI